MVVSKKGNHWEVRTKSGRLLGTHGTRAEAVAQLRAVEVSKRSHRK
jgi:hypothetical protein